MGLGKTVQLLALESVHARRRARMPGPRCCCARCRWSATGSGRRPSSRPALRVYAHHGRERLRGDALRERLGETDLVVTTYATATRDVDELAGSSWQRVVLDEAQAIKNSLSRTRARRCAGCAPATGSR